MEELPHQEVRGDLATGLLVVRGVGALDRELATAQRAHGEARARGVRAELLAQRGIRDSESYGPQFSSVHRFRSEPATPRPRAFRTARRGDGAASAV